MGDSLAIVVPSTATIKLNFKWKLNKKYEHQFLRGIFTQILLMVNRKINIWQQINYNYIFRHTTAVKR